MKDRVMKSEFRDSDIKRILIRSTNWVGDTVMTMPAFEAARKIFPGSSITVLAKPWVASLFEFHPCVDEVILYGGKDGYLEGLREMARIIGHIRKKRFDLAILFQNAFEAAFIAYLGGVRMRVGYNREGRGFLLTHRIEPNEEISKGHQTEYYLSILRSMGWKAKSRNPVLYVGNSNTKKAENLMRSHGIYPDDFVVALSPGAIFGKAKQWPQDRFAKIGDWAVQKWGAKVIVMGSHKEMGLCNVLCDIMKETPVDLSGKTSLGEAMGVISRCSIFVTNDSGLMHIAAALNVPTVAIFGSTDPSATGPLGLNSCVIRHEVDCSPCLRAECKRDYQCLRSIEPEEVWKAMEHIRGVMG